jgi:hypothetical protein
MPCAFAGSIGDLKRWMMLFKNPVPGIRIEGRAVADVAWPYSPSFEHDAHEKGGSHSAV